MEATKLEENLVLVGFEKNKGSDVMPGYRIKLQGNIPDGLVTPDNKKDPKLPQHGLMKITVRNLFEGVVNMTFTGKLQRVLVHAGKETPAYQTWDFRLANVPTRDDRIRLLDLATANGDEIEAGVEVVFTEQDEDRPPETSERPELFSDEEEEIERIKNGELDGSDGFDEGQESNVVEGSDAEAMLNDKKAKANA